MLNGVQYGPVSGIEFTGNVILPEVYQVLTTVNFGPNGSLAGLSRLPNNEVVLNGSMYGPDSENTTNFGDFTVPIPATVLNGTVYGPIPTDPISGTYNVPTSGQVTAGVHFGNNNTQNGTVTLPPVWKVLNDTSYGDNQTIGGNLTLPDVTDVIVGSASYGGNGTEFNGTYGIVTTDQVLDGVAFGNGDTGDVVLPSIDSVIAGVTFGPNSELTGDYTEPDPDGIIVGNHYGPNATLNGDYVVVIVSNVKQGITYGANGEQTGTLVSGSVNNKGSTSMFGTPLGYYQLTDVSTVKLLSTLSGAAALGATCVTLQAETKDVRFRTDGTNATAAIGSICYAGGAEIPIITGVTINAAVLALINVIEVASAAVLNVNFYRATRNNREF